MTGQAQAADFDALLARIPYAVFLGMQIVRDNHGLVYRLPFAGRLVGNASLPAVHGGVIAGFMENAAMLQILLIEPEQPRIPKTVDFSIDYLRSAGPRDTHARCSIARLGWRVAQVQVQCWQDNPEQPVALARAHFLLEAATGPEQESA
jgi:uncharacterized protein (TIGR00369 family)